MRTGSSERNDHTAFPPLDPDVLAARLKVLANPKRLHLLRFLAEPHYLEEIASELGTARQTAREHIQKLVEEGFVEKRQGRRDMGPVSEYIVAPQRLFAIMEDLGTLSSIPIHPRTDREIRQMTMMSGAGTDGHRSRRADQMTIVHGLRIGQTLSLAGPGPWTIGRDPSASLNLDFDPFVSVRHAEVHRTAQGLELVDLYSSNGVLVDWETLERGGRAPLHHGTLLRIGKTLLLVTAT